MIDRNEPTYMIGLDGGLRKIPAYMVNELQKQGWRMVTNPRRQYFPEFDRTNPNYKEQGEPEIEMKILKVDVI